jgi:hypothetical protein
VANTILTITMITLEHLRILENMLTFTARVSRKYDDKFGVEGAKIGTTLNIRKPVRYSQTTGQGLQLQDATETSVPLSLTTQYQRAFTFSSADLLLSVDEYADRFIKPAMASMANQIDFDGLLQYQNVYNEVGTPGTVPILTSTYLAAGQRLNEEAAPMDERDIIMSPARNASIVNALTGLFNPQVTISAQFKKGMMTKDTLGFDWFMDQNTRIQTVGPLGGSPTVNATAGQTGASIITTGWTAAAASRLNKGDIFTMAGVNAVNPQNQQSTGVLRQFVVTAPFSSDGSGNGAISIYPSIITSGPYQTVSAAPAGLAAIVVQGAANTASPRGLAFHPDAFAFVNADLPLPGGVDMAARKSSTQLGLSIRCIRQYDINTDRYPLRADLLGGWGTLYPELAVRIAS